MKEPQNQYKVDTGSNTPKPAAEAPSVIVMNVGGTQATKTKENGTAEDTPPKRRKNTNAGKSETRPSVPLRLPRNIRNLLTPILNEAIEAYITPDSVIAFQSETLNMHRDAGFWVLVLLPPIQTEPMPEKGTTYKIKPVTLAP